MSNRARHAGFHGSRPAGLRWFCGGLLAVGLLNLGVALRTLQLASLYTALGVSFPPLPYAIISLGWGGAFLWVDWRLWRIRNAALTQALILIVAFGLYHILWDRLFARSDYAVQRWPFAALATAVVVAAAALYLMRPRLRAFFNGSPAEVTLPDSALD